MSWNSADWKMLVAQIGKIAPALGTIVGGPVGGAVGTGIAILSKALGVENKPEAILKALETDPEAVVKIKQAELDHDIEIKELLYQTAIAGYQNDAKIIESLAKADASGHTTRPQIALMMAWLLVIPYTLIGVAIGWVIFKNPETVKDLWPVLLAYFGIPMTLLKMYFGDLRKEHAQAKGIPQSTFLEAFLGNKK